MHEPDAFDFADAEEAPQERAISCRHCGEGGLYWQSVWDRIGRESSVLFDAATRHRHECRAAADDFEDVS
jgi:hypothetical protein